MTKCGAGFGKTQDTILTGNGWILHLREKWNSPKFKQGMRDFFACVLKMWEIVRSSGKFKSFRTKLLESVPLYFLFYFIVFGKKRGIRESFLKKASCWIFVKRSGMLDPSSETRGQIVGARESLNGRKKMAQRKVKYGVVPYFSSRHYIFFPPV